MESILPKYKADQTHWPVVHNPSRETYDLDGIAY